MHPEILDRKKIEKREYELLAPYAMKSAETAGRVHKEKEHTYRTVYQRDRDRVIHSTAFRRLEYKTQVFVNHEGDYYRTRLTHTLEVAQISRAIARALSLNEDLVETVALAHDLGHTPFGHAGEETLNELMKDHGGFDHNTHGLRVVDILEKKYPSFCGLNLTQEVREGIILHDTPFDIKRSSEIDIKGPCLLEVQVVNVADEIAYDNHDLDDGLKSGLLHEGDLAGIPIWDETLRKVKSEFKDMDERTMRAQVVRMLINLQVTDAITSALKRIEDLKINSLSDLSEQKVKIVDFSEELSAKREQFKKVLMEKLYKHYRVARMTKKAARFLSAIFENYVENPEQLPPQDYEKIQERGKYQVICDYVAGMTDRYALDQYKKFFEPYERV